MKINLNELVEKQIITDETARKIQAYYQRDKQVFHQRLLLVFGILGAVFVGLGLILILAHNWDRIPRFLKLVLALLPLVFSQILGFYVLQKRYDSQTWREAVAILLFFSVAVSLSMVAQIYHISGDSIQFLLLWLALSLPLIYIFRASFLSLLWAGLLIIFVFTARSWTHRNDGRIYGFVLLWLAWLPYYLSLIRRQMQSYIAAFHHWVSVALLLVSLMACQSAKDDWRFLSYIVLFGVLYLLGSLPVFKPMSLIKNAYKITGLLGLSAILIFFTFDDFWRHRLDIASPGSFDTVCFYVFILLIIIWLYLFFRFYRHVASTLKNPLYYLMPALLIIYFSAYFFYGSVYIANLLALALAVYFIVNGSRQNRLLEVNYGMLMISVLIIFRFFDTDLSFIFKGISFMILGFAFFTVNYWLIKKKKNAD